MSEQPVETSGEDPEPKPSATAPRVEKRYRRTALSTGFSDLPGKTCAICGFQGFRWHTECPRGHPLS